ncbi:GxxExxY protein [Novipirellula caenicola]|uniref:GxxExxY protein n=1 Tax=Novipirellula caenicola TaxID=1536901 RepID=A0ABP9VIF2_9BACT
MSDSKFLFRDETHQIIGSAIEVLNEIGHGFYEKIYENALVVEFGLRNIQVVQQPDYPIIFKSVTVGTYIPDLICFGAVVVDTKTIEEITHHEIGKMLNYLKVTNLRVGLLINFKHAKLEFKRVVRSEVD